MTDLSGMTPAEQVRALGLAVGDTIEGWKDVLHGKHGARLKLESVSGDTAIWHYWSRDSLGKEWHDEGGGWEYALALRDWRKISSDPTLDPAEPLRRELMAAYALLKTCYDPYHDAWQECVDEWLARNAAFGGQKGGE